MSPRRADLHAPTRATFLRLRRAQGCASLSVPKPAQHTRRRSLQGPWRACEVMSARKVRLLATTGSTCLQLRRARGLRRPRADSVPLPRPTHAQTRPAGALEGARGAEPTQRAHPRAHQEYMPATEAGPGSCASAEAASAPTPAVNTRRRGPHTATEDVWAMHPHEGAPLEPTWSRRPRPRSSQGPAHPQSRLCADCGP